jgi:hypothetical protein
MKGMVLATGQYHPFSEPNASGNNGHKTQNGYSVRFQFHYQYYTNSMRGIPRNGENSAVLDGLNFI